MNRAQIAAAALTIGLAAGGTATTALEGRPAPSTKCAPIVKDRAGTLYGCDNGATRWLPAKGRR